MAKLTSEGRDTADAVDLLDAFEASLAIRKQQRNLLNAESDAWPRREGWRGIQLGRIALVSSSRELT